MDKNIRHCATSIGGCLSLVALAFAVTGCAAGGVGQRYKAHLSEFERLSPGLTVEQSVGTPVESLFAGVDVLERQGLVRLVLERNPSIEAARQAWRGALARYPQEKALDDPSVGYTFAPRSIGAGDARFGEVVGVTQRFPFPGKRGLRGMVALAEAEAAQYDYEATRLTLALMASTLFDELYAAERSLEVNEEHLSLVEELKHSAETRYAAGRASLQDPLQAEVELAHLEHQRIVLGTQRTVVVAQLNGLLRRAPQAHLPRPPSREPPPPLPSRTAAALEEEALRARPELQAASARIGGAESALSLQKREYYPDLTLGGSYNSMWGQPEHRVTVGLSINLPIQLGRRRAATEQAQAELSRRQSELEKRADEVRVHVEQARVRAIEAGHVLTLYRERLIPVANDQLAAARSGFESGQNTFLAVIEGEKNLRTVELGAEIATADAHRRAAELWRAVGRLPWAKEEEKAK